MSIVHGRATIVLNGRTLKTAAGATLDKGGFTKTSVSTDQGYVGVTRAFRPSKIECTCPFVKGDSLADYDFVDAVVTFECDSGQTYVITNANSVGEQSLAAEGVKLTIEGPEAQEIV